MRVIPGHRITLPHRLWQALLLSMLLAACAMPFNVTPPARAQGVERPVLAFYFSWYKHATWSHSTMSDLPAVLYDSGDQAAIDRQISNAARAGISGFIVSWWGPGSIEDQHFTLMLDRVAAWNARMASHFALSIYLDSDAPLLKGPARLTQGIRYVLDRYSAKSTFFHWQGQPVIFIWDPLGGGRTLSTWKAIRTAVDPAHRTFWSVDTIDVNVLDAFDGMHLFGAGYWGITQHYMLALYQGFRAKVDAYNKAHGTHKLWAAGVLPGYDDHKTSSVKQPLIVPRANGGTYTLSWQAAIASKPGWVTISTYNHWYLGDTIEPSASYGATYLNLTKRFAAQWRAGA